MKLPLFKFLALTSVIFGLSMIFNWTIQDRQLAANVRLMCEVINPKLQTGALRESMEYILSNLRSGESGAEARIILKTEGHTQTFGDIQRASHTFSCSVYGLPATELVIDIQDKPSQMWLGLFLFSVLASWALLRALHEIKDRTESVLLSSFESELGRIFDFEIASERKSHFPFIDTERSPHVRKLKFLIQNLKNTVDIQAQQLAQSSARAALGDLVAHVAHDLRSPLSVISLLSKDHKPTNKSASELMDKAVTRLNAICEDVLRTRQDLMNRKQTGVISVIEQSMALFKAAHPQINIKLVSHQEDILNPLDDLDRFLDILIANARDSIEASQHPGEIEIEFSSTATSIQIYVKDNGIGFPESLLKEGPRRGFTTKSQGYGLGLAFIQNRLLQIGGELTLENSENQQARVTVQYPRQLTLSDMGPPLTPCLQN